MTTKRGILLLFAITMVAFMILPAHGDWEVEQIEHIADDGFITETGGAFFGTPWVQIKGGSVNLASFFAFRGVTIPDNSTILGAYLEFTAPFPWNYNQTLDGTVYGLKTLDLPSWNPTPSLLSEPLTLSFTDFDIAPLISGVSINITVTEQVKEIYGLFGWKSNNDMGFTARTVAVSGGARYAEAYDGDPLLSAKLYIEYAGSNATAQYYKGYLITSPTPGQGANLGWNDQTNNTYRLTTVVGDDVLTRLIPYNLNTIAPDAICSVGTDLYLIAKAQAPPWNVSLVRTSDRGSTYTNLGEIKALSDPAGGIHINAMVYDQNNSLHITYAKGYDTYWKQFKIHNQSFTAEVMIHDGGFSINEHRSYWDDERNTVWFTRSGGTPGGSAVVATVLRRADSDGVWESYTLPYTPRIESDVTAIDGTMWWVVNKDNDRLIAHELMNYADITSWNISSTVGGFTDYIAAFFDVGIWKPGATEYLVVTMERGGVDAEMWLCRWWEIGSTWDTWNYNLTGWAPSSQPQFHAPKHYYDSEDALRMAIIVEQDSGYSLIDKDWVSYQTWEPTPPTGVLKATTHIMTALGGDMFPFSSGQTQWNVYDENGTLIGTFDSLEDAQIAIDDIEGQTPDDPNPPGTTYPEDGFGELTRFNMRFYIWMIGWVLVFIPPLAMAFKSYEFKMYLAFFIVEVFGWSLLWSIASI